jgi:hypothetical protein
MQVSGNAAVFRPAGWPKNHPIIFFCLFFQDPFARCGSISNPALGGGSLGKIAKNRFPGLTRAIDRPFAPIEITRY